MDINFRQIAIGLGIAVFWVFFRYRWPAVNKYIAYGGMIVGVLIAAIGFLPSQSPLAKERLPGFSTTIGLKINDAAKLGRQYIFEYSDPEGAKTSFYLLETNRFAFSVSDTRGETYSIEVPLGSGGIPLGRFIFLTCQIGGSASATFLRVLVNEKDVQDRSYPFPIDLGSKAWVRGTIGADNRGQHNSAFEALAFNAMGHVTLTNNDVASLIGGLSQYLRDINSPLAKEL
jgi:hypothetical protein